jgi:hypothetical protein
VSRTLFFDIDGTLLVGSFGRPKAALADGAFERALRAAGFERLVCVGNVVGIVRQLEAGPLARQVDGHAMVLGLCQGAFADPAWFRSVTTLVTDPRERAKVVAAHADDDWAWVDDQAERYCAEAGLDAFFDAHLGRRIFVPTFEGDGQDVLAWLGRIVRA